MKSNSSIFILLFILFSVSLTGKDIGRGAIAFQVRSNYSMGMLGTNALKLELIDQKTWQVYKTNRQPKSKLTTVNLPVGTYRLAALSSSFDFYVPPRSMVFEVQENAITYIGELDYQVQRTTAIKSFAVSDKSNSAVEELKTIGDDRIFINEVRPLKIVPVRDKQTKEIMIKKGTSLKSLEGRGVFAISISAKPNGPGFMSMPLGGMVNRKEVSYIDLKIAKDGDNHFRVSMEGKMLGNAGRIKLEEYCETKHIAYSLLPGKYYLQNIVVNFQDSSYSWLTVPLDIPFTIHEGKTTYLGDIFAQSIKEKTLGFSHRALADFYISNQWERDQPYFTERFPAISTLELVEEILTPNGLWKDIINSNAYQPN